MHCRDTTLMHVCAISKMLYGLAFVGIFVVGLLREVNSGQAQLTASRFAWAVRSLFAIFMVCTVCGYKRILSFSYEEELDPGSYILQGEVRCRSSWQLCKGVA